MSGHGFHVHGPHEHELEHAAQHEPKGEEQSRGERRDRLHSRPPANRDTMKAAIAPVARKVIVAAIERRESITPANGAKVGQPCDSNPGNDTPGPSCEASFCVFAAPVGAEEEVVYCRVWLRDCVRRDWFAFSSQLESCLRVG